MCVFDRAIRNVSLISAVRQCELGIGRGYQLDLNTLTKKHTNNALLVVPILVLAYCSIYRASANNSYNWYQYSSSSCCGCGWLRQRYRDLRRYARVRRRLSRNCCSAVRSRAERYPRQYLVLGGRNAPFEKKTPQLRSHNTVGIGPVEKNLEMVTCTDVCTIKIECGGRIIDSGATVDVEGAAPGVSNFPPGTWCFFFKPTTKPYNRDPNPVPLALTHMNVASEAERRNNTGRPLHRLCSSVVTMLRGVYVLTYETALLTAVAVIRAVLLL